MDADLVGGMALVAQAAVLLPGGGQAAQLAVLVHWVHYPVDAGVLHNIPAPFSPVLLLMPPCRPRSSAQRWYKPPMAKFQERKDPFSASVCMAYVHCSTEVRYQEGML